MSNVFGYVPWPPDLRFVESLLQREEDTLLDFKREWYDLDKNAGKAECAKDVLAMSNAASEGHAGLLAIGFVETPTGKIVALENIYPAETVSNILSYYVNLLPDVRVYTLTHPQGQ